MCVCDHQILQPLFPVAVLDDVTLIGEIPFPVVSYKAAVSHKMEIEEHTHTITHTHKHIHMHTHTTHTNDPVPPSGGGGGEDKGMWERMSR